VYANTDKASRETKVNHNTQQTDGYGSEIANAAYYNGWWVTVLLTVEHKLYRETWFPWSFF